NPLILVLHFYVFSNRSKTRIIQILTGSCQFNMKKASLVFYVSLAIVGSLVLMGILMPTTLEKVTSVAQNNITNSFGWYYLVLVMVFVVACAYLFVSPLGRIKLGKQEDEPEFSKPTWL